MKRLFALLLIISLPTAAMNHTESASGDKKKGQEGFFQDAINLAASPITAGAEQAAQIAMNSMAQYKHELIAEIAAKVAAANQAQIETLNNKIDTLQKTIVEQNKGCCTIQ